jgi:hypothetical protein
MPNTLDSNLISQILAKAAIETLPGLLPNLNAVSLIRTDETLAVPAGIIPGHPSSLSITVPNVTSLGAILENPASFEVGDVVVDGLPVAMNHLVMPFTLAAGEQQTGANLEWMARSALQKLAGGIWNKVAALFTTGNFATAVTQPAANFGSLDLEDLRRAVKSPRRSLLLDTDYYSAICPPLLTAGPLTLAGFNGGCSEVDFTSAGATVKGAVLDKTAIVAVYGPPKFFGGVPILTGSVNVPELGISVTGCQWMNTASRSFWFSYEIVFGAAVAKAASCQLVVTPS